MDLYSIIGIIAVVIIVGAIIMWAIKSVVTGLIKLLVGGILLFILFFALKGCVGF